MNKMIKLAGLLTVAAVCLFSAPEALAGIHPEWVRKGEAKMNKSRVSDNYEFKVFHTWSGDYNLLWEERFVPLMDYLGECYGTDRSKMQLDSLATNPVTYRIRFRDANGDAVVYAQRPAVYSAFEDFSDSDYEFNYYQLYAVTGRNGEPVFDRFTEEPTSNLNATLMSIVPGLGQFYKGDNDKGKIILGSEVLMAASAIVCQFQDSYNKNRLSEKDLEERPSWESKELGWRGFRNLSLIGMAAMYVYNLIDAAAAKGGSRVTVSGAPSPQFSIEPSPSTNGVAFVYRF